MVPVADAVLLASRALVAVAARSLGAAGVEVTLPQYRALVVLAARGPQGVGGLALSLGVAPSTVTRMGARLVHKGLVSRRTPAADRRQSELALTKSGRQLVDDVTGSRRSEIARVVESLSPAQRTQLVEALGVFANAAGELPDADWAAGWAL